MSDDGETVVRVRGLRNAFGRQVVHDGLDLDVHRGEVLGVIGGSGAGKSVLLRSIVGLKDPDGGQIVFLGQDTTHLGAEQRRTLERRLGLMFHQPIAVVPIARSIVTTRPVSGDSYQCPMAIPMMRI